MGHVCVRKNNSLFCIRLAIEVQKKKFHFHLSIDHMCLPEDISYQIFSSLKPNLWTFGVLERGGGDTLDFVSFTTRWSESIFCTLKL